MLIPIGLDETSMHRKPWISFSIIALCVLVYVIQHHLVQGRMEDALVRFVEYYGNHPYLEVTEEDWQALDETGMLNVNFLRELLENYHRLMTDLGDEAPDSFQTVPSYAEKREQQLILEGYLDDLFVALEENFDGKDGLNVQKPNVMTAFSHIFLHAGFFHLLGNRLFFYITAPLVEDRWNRPFFVVF